MISKRRLIYNLAHASKKHDATYHKQVLLDHVKKAKKVAELNDTKKLQKELVKLEKKVRLREDADLAYLENKLHNLESEKEHTNSPQLKKRLDRILFLLGELSARVDKQEKKKDAKKKRQIELEKQIKEHSQLPLKLQKLGEAITILEEKYADFKTDPNVGRNRLQKIEKRLKLMRQKLENYSEMQLLPLETPHRLQPKKIVKHRMMYPQSLPSIGKQDSMPFGNSGELPQKRRAKHTFISHKPLEDLRDVPTPICFDDDEKALHQELIQIENQLDSDLPPPPAPRKKGLFKRLFR